MKNTGAILIAAVILGLLGLFFFWPLILTVKSAFVFDQQWTFAFFGELFQNPIYPEGLRNSLALAVVTTGLVALIALPLAILAARFDFSGKAWLTGLILLPMILPPFVGAIGIRQILGPAGALNALLVKLNLIDWPQAVDWLGQGRFWAVALTEALHLYPIFYLNAVAAIANVDPSLEEAAENLGCTGLQRFRRITLPLMMPGLFAGGTLVFIWSFTELGTPLMFDYMRVTPVQIYHGIQDIAGSPLPYALVVVMLGASAILYALGKGLFGRASYEVFAKSGTAAGMPRLHGLRAGAALSLFTIVFALSILPHLGVLLTSFSQAWYRSAAPTQWTLEWYHQALSSALTLPSIRNSCFYALVAMLADLILGVAAAVVIVRSRLRWRGALDLCCMLPLAVPGIVLAFGYIAMSQPGRIFSGLNPTENPTGLLIIAYAVRRLPYVVRAAVAGLQQISTSLEEAAENLGCPPGRTVIKITLPLISANLIAGGLLAFSFAMLEVSDSLMLAQKQVYFPITKALYELFQVLGNGPYLAAALGVWAMVFLGITLLLVNRLLGRRLGAIFRL
ncbi:MAG: iron ABC transporter permease [Lentisphaerae bacterium]|nr:iron ABC transporter permease [Lentisphaerota bacterium]